MFHINQSLKLIVKILAVLLALLAAALFLLIAILYLFLPNITSLANSNPTTTAFIKLYQEKKAKQNKEEYQLDWQWVPLSKISPIIIHSVIYTEDTTFWSHGGIEWSQIKNAFKKIWHHHRIITGGSTITQQVAKNLYLSPDRSFLRKLRELLIAFELEKHLSKERILEIYLNIAEWGNGIFGIEAASFHWYQCSANELTTKQAISLIFILPNPDQRNPTKLSPRLVSYANLLIVKLAAEGVISEEEVCESLILPNHLIEEKI